MTVQSGLSQRIELQKLRQRRESDVRSMVNSGTSQLKAEVKQLQNMLQSTSEQLLQTLSEREQARSQTEQCTRALEELRRASSAQEHHLLQRLQSLEEAFTKGVDAIAALADSVEAFQRHVLPTFKPSALEMNKGSLNVVALNATVEGKSLMEQLTRLESGLALLRVIVDAKNDTLVLIRGKLKQENEELKAELQVARESMHCSHSQIERTPPSFDGPCSEKNLLRQELQSLQNIFNEEVKQLKTKLKMYESGELQGQGQLIEVQKELVALQNKLGSVEASRALLEASLKEETAARTQLISQLFALRKDNEKAKTELETLKLSQKFLVRHPRSGHIPAEKLDLMNTVNQLLSEINRLKGEKVALEEELKARKRSQVREQLKTTVTPRDVELAASNKVNDTELASKLARARLQELGMQENAEISIAIAPHTTDDLNSTPVLKPIAARTCSPMRMQTEYLHKNGLQGIQSIEIPI
ncbi:hypothetical protein KP509_26G016400 [Ceratopteris richardii]|uniref:Uncharacterized protein n=1 Tax=Ceratopteris richardii TaxID=49495 RepID=A0A8T2RL37_CERRI|nr:hypothetical protein KP509_26G016400 [Ceratopteris richardii]